VSGKPSLRQHLKENKEAVERLYAFLNHFMQGYNQIEQVVDILYELHKDDINGIIEDRIKTKEEKGE